MKRNFILFFILCITILLSTGCITKDEKNEYSSQVLQDIQKFEEISEEIEKRYIDDILVSNVLTRERLIEKFGVDEQYFAEKKNTQEYWIEFRKSFYFYLDSKIYIILLERYTTEENDSYSVYYLYETSEDDYSKIYCYNLPLEKQLDLMKISEIGVTLSER